MALIRCPECGRERVSDNANACPECGYGIKAHFEKIRKEEEEKRKREDKEKNAEAELEKIKKITSLARKPKLYSNEGPIHHHWDIEQ